MFEYNVRHGTVIGLVGAGGIGLYINTYLKLQQYDKVVALLIVVFLVVVVIDFVSMALRSAVTEEGDVDRPAVVVVVPTECDFVGYAPHADEEEHPRRA
ncbi:MAG: hypothetical protein CM15mP78_15470 [Candidatus Poseidoniales archaeon]|nr:MAG: hypothetical protein CM15mP78_15470 [Candidatus Poseidoniales archaeon]